MKNISALTAVTATMLAASLFIAPVSFAKGHNQGFGAGSAGPATAGAVDDGQTNRGADKSDERGRSGSTYGQTDATLDAKDGVSGNSVDAQNRDASNHPSNRE